MDDTEQTLKALTTAVAMCAAMERGDNEGARELWNATADDEGDVTRLVQALTMLPTLILAEVPSDPAAYYRVMLTGLANRP